MSKISNLPFNYFIARTAIASHINQNHSLKKKDTNTFSPDFKPLDCADMGVRCSDSRPFADGAVVCVFWDERVCWRGTAGGRIRPDRPMFGENAGRGDRLVYRTTRVNELETSAGSK